MQSSKEYVCLAKIIVGNLKKSMYDIAYLTFREVFVLLFYKYCYLKWAIFEKFSYTHFGDCQTQDLFQRQNQLITQFLLNKIIDF